MNILDLINAEKKKQDAKAGDGIKTVKAQSGKNLIRILPTWRKDGDLQFWHHFGQHFVKGLERNDSGKQKLKSVYVCLDRAYDKPCPVCQALEQAGSLAKSDDQALAIKDSKAGGVVLVNALNLSTWSENKEEPVIFQMPGGVWRTVLNIIQEYGDITELDGGIDLTIVREGKGLETKYTVMPAPKSIKVNKSVLDNVSNLDELIAAEVEDLNSKNRALSSLRNTAGIASGTSDDEPFDVPAIDAPSTTALLADKAEVVETKPVIEAEVVEEVITDVVADEPAPTETNLSDDELDDLLADL